MKLFFILFLLFQEKSFYLDEINIFNNNFSKNNLKLLIDVKFDYLKK
jgi:hypothetical protein